MTEAKPPRPPFDPVRGAWILLMLMIVAVFANSVFIFIGCLEHIEAACNRSGVQLRDLGTELIAAVAVLIAARR